MSLCVVESATFIVKLAKNQAVVTTLPLVAFWCKPVVYLKAAMEHMLWWQITRRSYVTGRVHI